MPLVARRSRRWWRALAIVLACGWLVDHFALPALAGRSIRLALASRGYPDARFEVARVGVDSIRLRDVELAAGVDLGEVELDVGLSALWGARARSATIRGARVALEAVKPLVGGASGGGSPPLDRVRVERALLTRGRDRVTITGELSLAGPLAAELHATGLRVGGLDVDELALRVRETGADRYGATWELHGDGWTARGDGALARTGGALALAHGRTELRADTLHAGGVVLERATAALDLRGPLTALEVRGDARAERVELARAAAPDLRLRDVRVPIAVRVRSGGGALAVLGRSVVATAGEATLATGDHAISATGLEVELGGATGGDAGDDASNTEERTLVALGDAPAWPAGVRWRAATVRGGPLRAEGVTGSYTAATNVHALAWRSLAARSLDLGDGAIELGVAGERLRIARARLALAGGELSAASAPGAPGVVTVTARGLELGRLLPRRAVEATVVLDGEVAARFDGGGATFLRGELHARGRGRLRITDPALRERIAALAGVERRVAGALVDFEHTALAGTLAPRGAEPELRLTVRGRGARVAQELDLSLNVRGVWAALDRLARSYL